MAFSCLVLDARQLYLLLAAVCSLCDSKALFIRHLRVPCPGLQSDKQAELVRMGKNFRHDVAVGVPSLLEWPHRAAGAPLSSQHTPPNGCIQPAGKVEGSFSSLFLWEAGSVHSS